MSGPTDRIRAWRLRNTLAVWGATWAFNPKQKRENYADQYLDNPVIADRDFAAIPPQTVEGALRSAQLVEELFNKARRSPIDSNGGFYDWFKGDAKFEYYLHIDMSKRTDATGLGMSHYDQETDKVVVDLIHTIHSTKEWELSFSRIFHLVLELQNRGFRFAKVTFDSWQSYHMLEQLQNAGIPAELYSVDKGTEAYDTLISSLLSQRLDYYFNAVFVKELKNLKLYGGTKYDHPDLNEDGTPGSKDTSDGVAGSVTKCLKSLMGLMFKESDLTNVTQVIPVFNWSNADGRIQLEPLQNIVAVERVRPRTARIDAVDDTLLICGGYHYGGRLISEFFLRWQNFDQPEVFEEVTKVLYTLFTNLKMESFSLNEHVPVELINFLQSHGRRITSALATSSSGMLMNTSVISKKSIRLLVSAIKQAKIHFFPFEDLIKDLRYMTHDNMMERRYVACLAGWYEFMSKEASFGTASKSLPKISMVATSLNQSSHQVKPTHNFNSTTEIERLRQRYFATGIKTTEPASSTAKRLPRIPR